MELIQATAEAAFQSPGVNLISYAQAQVVSLLRSIPDGYLGTIRTRRDDRGRPGSTSENVLDSLKVRITQRGYQRGVHKGERIDSAGYYYPDELRPERGILRQLNSTREGNVLMSKRNSDAQHLAPAPHLPNDGKAGPAAKSDAPMGVNLNRAKRLSSLSPNWK